MIIGRDWNIWYYILIIFKWCRESFEMSGMDCGEVVKKGNDEVMLFFRGGIILI